MFFWLAVIGLAVATGFYASGKIETWLWGPAEVTTPVSSDPAVGNSNPSGGESDTGIPTDLIDVNTPPADSTDQGSTGTDEPVQNPAPESPENPTAVITWRLPDLMAYRLQVGAFGKETNAAQETDRLKKLGFRPVTIKDGGLFKVFLGGFSTKAAALSVRDAAGVKDALAREYTIVGHEVDVSPNGAKDAYLDLKEGWAAVGAAFPAGKSEASVDDLKVSSSRLERLSQTLKNAADAQNQAEWQSQLADFLVLYQSNN
jgi:hypothetical protein